MKMKKLLTKFAIFIKQQKQRNFLRTFAFSYKARKMQKPIVKYLIVILLALIYINRGLFISSAHEMENQGSKEINSVIELAWQLITGECNDIDEDGDLQTDCNHVKTVQHDFSNAQSFELANLFSKNINKRFSNKENFLAKDFCSQIDQPPEI